MGLVIIIVLPFMFTLQMWYVLYASELERGKLSIRSMLMLTLALAAALRVAVFTAQSIH